MEVQKYESTLPKRREISVMGDHNDDLLVEILVRLPCKYVIQFMCVCKRWMSLISNPRFIHYFLDCYHHRNSRSSSSSSLSLSSKSNSKKKKKKKKKQCWSFITLFPSGRWRGENEIRFLVGRGPKGRLPLFKPDLPFLPKICSDEREQKQNKLFVVQCFNDLILCSRGDNRNPTVYYICNPLTMQFLTLPPPPPPHVDEIVYTGFVCEPLSMYPNNRFRVVRLELEVCTRYFPLSAELEIFSSETGLWSKSTLAVSHPTGVTAYPNSWVKLVSFENGQMILFTGAYIIKFDAFAAGCRIKGQFINLPDEFSPGNKYNSETSVIVSQGQLFLLRIFILCDENFATFPQIKVWKKCNDRESNWMLAHHVQFREMKVIQEGVVTPLVARVTDEEYKRMYTRSGSPHSKEHRRTWLGNFLNGVEQSCYQNNLTHKVVFIGFDINYSYLMYFILYPPELALPALAAYNMRTRAIQLLPESKVPLHLGYFTGVSYEFSRTHRIFPLVLQPWPTPLPQPSL